MSAITKDDVLNFAQEFVTSAAPTAAAWADIIAYVNEFDLGMVESDASSSPRETAQTARMARIFLAAHIAKMDKLAKSSAAGPLTGESVGGVRRSYGLVSAGGAGSLSTTRYGQLYMEVLGMSIASGPMVI